MSAPTQPQTPPQPPAGYTGMDDILIPVPALHVTIQEETHPFAVIGTDEKNKVELATRVYVGSTYFKDATSTVTLADRWVARHSSPESKFDLLTRSAVDASMTPPVLDEHGKVFSPPYTLVFESNGAADYPGTIRGHDDKHNRQMFYFLPISATQIFTARVVREVKYFATHPMFEPQLEHFLTTLKRDTATPQSTLKGSKSLTRRYYTAYFSFEISTPEKPKGNNQWSISGHASTRIDLWHTQEGEIVVSYSVISGYDFAVARENQKLMGDAKGLVKNLSGLVKSMDPNAYVPKLKYLELPFPGGVIYGHAEENAADRGGRISWKLDVAYKTGKQLSLSISGPAAAMHAQEKALHAWLAQFKILQ